MENSPLSGAHVDELRIRLPFSDVCFFFFLCDNGGSYVDELYRDAVHF